jgi:HD-GYP domain-containing protein (c-di-GMP phosphodiesterase class II)
MRTVLSIDQAMAVVSQGGKIRTGIDVYDKNGVLLLGSSEVVDKVSTLNYLKENGLASLPLLKGPGSGLWNSAGEPIGGSGNSGGGRAGSAGRGGGVHPARVPESVEKRLVEIQEIRRLAVEQYDIAKATISKVLGDIRKTGGEFDYSEVEGYVDGLMRFLTAMNNPFAYLTKEIFSYDDYLYNHSVNVCAIGTAVLNAFNGHFSSVVNRHIDAETPSGGLHDSGNDMGGNAFCCYFEDELRDIVTGFFLHDIGKVMVPETILNKPGKLTDTEFDLIRNHSSRFGSELLEKNRIRSAFIRNIIQNHHVRLYEREERCYPQERHPSTVPFYVRICKLADIYDAMTSKRSYKEAFNQINVVTEIFRHYAKKDRMLQFVLHAFVKSVGIYPPGSIVYLRDGRMAYVLESAGPIVLPFTDTRGGSLGSSPDPLDLGAPGADDMSRVDGRKSIRTPLEVYDLLPAYLKKGAPVQETVA